MKLLDCDTFKLMIAFHLKILSNLMQQFMQQFMKKKAEKLAN